MKQLMAFAALLAVGGAILRAESIGDISRAFKAKGISQKGMSPNKKDKGKQLSDYIEDDDAENIKRLADKKKASSLEDKKEWRKEDTTYTSPVEKAVKTSKWKALEALLDKGFSIPKDIKDTVASDAIKNKISADLFQKLIDKGATVKSGSKDIMSDAMNNNASGALIDILIAKGADASGTVYALRAPIVKKDYAAVTNLMNEGIDLSKGGTLPNGCLSDPDLIYLLLSNQSSDKIKSLDLTKLVDDKGHDLLWEAIMHNDLWLVGYLIGTTVSPKYWYYEGGSQGSTPRELYPLVDQKKNDVTKFRILSPLFNVAKKYAADGDKNSIMVASSLPQPSAPGYDARPLNYMIKRILTDALAARNKADLNTPDKDGKTTIMWLLTSGLDIIQPINKGEKFTTYDQAFWVDIPAVNTPQRGDYWVQLIDAGAALPTDQWMNSLTDVSYNDRRKPQIGYARTKRGAQYR